MGAAEVEAFLTMLASERQVSPAIHRQALNALLFLYKQVLGQDLPWMQAIGRPPERKRIPVVLSADEVQSVLLLIPGVEGTLARLLYGTGMRLAEGWDLRVKDVDFDRQVIVARSGKGDKARVVMLPRSIVLPLRAQLARSRALWSIDRSEQRSGVYMPHALETKYPRAGQSWAWHWVFPADHLSVDPRTEVERRHHLYDERLGRQLKRAVSQAGICGDIAKRIGPHRVASLDTSQIARGFSPQP